MYRPALETLERREVFSAGPLGPEAPLQLESLSLNFEEIRSFKTDDLSDLVPSPSPIARRDSLVAHYCSSDSWSGACSSGVFEGNDEPLWLVARSVGGTTEGRPTEQMSLNMVGSPIDQQRALAVTTPKLDGGSKEAGFFAYPILPYIEQDNLYKFLSVASGDVNRDATDEVVGLAAADFNRDGFLDVTFDRDMNARDAIFARIGAERQQGIIAILIG